jgi:transcriptional regulator with XRE-family HTH domain
MMRKKDPEKVDIGRRFREAREKKGWTREQLAEVSDLSVPFLADLELGNTGVRLDRFQKLCKLLEVDADYVLFGEAPSSLAAITAMLRGRDEKTLRVAERTLRAMLEALDEE